MTNKITCRTLFDITATGVRSHYRASLIPFKDETGKVIADTSAWDRARNQQRNWETVNQVISLRVLPEEISQPAKVQDNGRTVWEFTFCVPSLEAVQLADDPVGALVRDCDSVPMILGLDENSKLNPMLESAGDSVNIWFWVTMDK